MGSSPRTAGAAVVAAVAAGGVPGRLGGRGTRACAVEGAAAWSSADRPAALDAREAVADPAVDLDRRGAGGGCIAGCPAAEDSLLSIAQQFHVTQCFGGMSHCNLFCTLTLYLMLSHVLDFGGTL